MHAGKLLNVIKKKLKVPNEFGTDAKHATVVAQEK
jgi:hypothetical protein